MGNKSAKCIVQARLEETSVQMWESRKIVELWNCVVQLPWRTVIVHYAVLVIKVTSFRVETT